MTWNDESDKENRLRIFNNVQESYDECTLFALKLEIKYSQSQNGVLLMIYV